MHRCTFPQPIILLQKLLQVVLDLRWGNIYSFFLRYSFGEETILVVQKDTSRHNQDPRYTKNKLKTRLV
jgi:hypothetical protein